MFFQGKNLREAVGKLRGRQGARFRNKRPNKHRSQRGACVRKCVESMALRYLETDGAHEVGVWHVTCIHEGRGISCLVRVLLRRGPIPQG